MIENIPGVSLLGKVKIIGNIIQEISIEKESLGSLLIRRLDKKDSSALFNFYFKGLSEKSRIFFPPYPLFSPIPKSANDLYAKIVDWQKEGDWTVLLLMRDSQIIGMGLLKRYKTKRPTSGLAVRENFQKMGLGLLLQTIINEQARFLGLKKLYVSMAKSNVASMRLHQKCGFKETGKLLPHYIYKNGVKIIDRYDIEMAKEI